MLPREDTLKMKAVSIGTTFNYSIPLKDQLPMIRRAGFTHISIGAGDMEHSNYMHIFGQKNIREMAQNEGLGICSIHAPFLGENTDISSCDVRIASEALDMLKKCIDAAVSLNSRIIAFHPCSMKIDKPEERKALLIDQIHRLIKYIGKEDVKLAVENLPSTTANDILFYVLNSIYDPRFGLCYDSSHDNLTGPRLEILKKYGARLIATHISDNRGVKDDHMLPFEGTFCWKDFCAVFGEIDYKGVFLLEVEMRESAFKIPDEFLAEAFARAVRLLNRL
jgi:sugar phosphate isomerase/epimerase